MSWARKIRHSRLYLAVFRLAVPNLTALIFFAVVFLFYPYRLTFQFDSDEGINLIKAMLVEDGFPLFNQVWSDQPPVFTLLLAAVFKLAQNDLIAGRTLVLSFASLLAWCLAYLVQKIWSPRHALFVLLLLLLLPYFPVLSVSVMVGLPAISLAFLSLAAIFAWHGSHKSFWLLVSGAALGLSIMTKLFTGILVPVIALGIFAGAIGRAATASSAAAMPRSLSGLLRDARMYWRQGAGQVLLWLAVLALAAGGITLLVVRPEHVLDLILPHVSAVQADYFDAYVREYPLWRVFAGAPVFLILACVGGALALQARRWLALYPAAWAVAAMTLLSFHSPVWYHHTLLVTLPACVLAAGAAGEGLELSLSLLRKREISPASLARLGFTAIVLAALFWLRLPPAISEFEKQPYFISLQNAQPPREEKILDEVLAYKPYTSWMFTDLPMFAFRADIPVLPGLAVLTSKRLASGELTEEAIISQLQQYRPEIILLGRYEFPGLEAILAQGYRLEDSRLKIKLYIRSDLPGLN